MAASLYERLGGKPAIDTAVDIFYQKIMADVLLSPFFAKTDIQRQRAKQKAFLAYAFGGAPGYDGRKLRDAHVEAVRHGLSDQHFDAVADHLHATLKELGVTDNLVGEVMVIVGATRNEVLNR